MAAKYLEFNTEARARLKRGVDQLANAVKITLGPKGRNVVIEKKFGNPTITKDGVTVAKEIELEDAVENMGAQMVKEVATKTSDIAGDGTTTATVLAQAIFREGLQPEDRLRQHRRGGRAVPGDVGRLGRHFLHHLGAHVLHRILELELLCDRHAVLGHRRVTELLLDDDVATLRTEGDLHRVRQLVHAPLEARAGLRIEFEVLGSHLVLSRSAELGDDVGFLDQDDLFLVQLDLR